MIEELKDVKKAEALFSGWQDSVVWAAVQGVMGSIYVDSLENPRSGAVMLGDFCFLSGRPMEEMVKYTPKWCQAKTRYSGSPECGMGEGDQRELWQTGREKSTLCHKKGAGSFRFEETSGSS